MALAQGALGHHRAITIAALAVLAAIAWAWIVAGAGMGMDPLVSLAPVPAADMPMTDMATKASWSVGEFALVVSMWWVMMVAMMLPAAAPTILLYAKAAQTGATAIRPSTGAFLTGYLVVWGGFSLLASLLQMMFVQNGVLGRMSMTSENSVLSAAVLVGAGIYQLSPLKESCLRQCRSPAHFIARHFRPGGRGAMRMGLVHGAYCVGCCWLLMTLLFVGGVMNLAWIALLTLLVAAEKLLPRGRTVAIVAGLACLGWGIAILAT